MSEEMEKSWIAKFWTRIGALLIDSLLLGLVGFILGLAFKSAFVQLGDWGRLIGFGVALIYFGTMNSKIFAGQTIGKKLLKLRVVNADNQPISLGRSILRYIVLATPFFLNGVHLSNEVMLSFLSYPLSLMVFGGMLSILYLYVFNRITRQSLHDLAAGTYVVNANTERREVGKVWKVHIAIVAALFIAAAIAPALTKKLAQNEPFKEMLATKNALSHEPGVIYSTIFTGTTNFKQVNEEAKTTTYVSVQVFLSSNRVNDAELARHLANIVVKNYPESRQKDAMTITLTYGYDTGIWSQWSSRAYDFIPGALQGVE